MTVMNFLWSLTLIGRMENIYHRMQIGVFATFTLSTGIKNVLIISEDNIILYLFCDTYIFFNFLSPIFYLHLFPFPFITVFWFIVVGCMVDIIMHISGQPFLNNGINTFFPSTFCFSTS